MCPLPRPSLAPVSGGARELAICCQSLQDRRACAGKAGCRKHRVPAWFHIRSHTSVLRPWSHSPYEMQLGPLPSGLCHPTCTSHTPITWLQCPGSFSPPTLFTVSDSSWAAELVPAARSAVPSQHSGSTVAPGVTPASGIGKYLPSKRPRPWWWLGWTAASGQPRWIPGAGQGSWEGRVCGGLV